MRSQTAERSAEIEEDDNWSQVMVEAARKRRAQSTLEKYQIPIPKSLNSKTKDNSQKVPKKKPTPPTEQEKVMFKSYFQTDQQEFNTNSPTMTNPKESSPKPVIPKKIKF